MFWSSPIPKNVRKALAALKDLPRGARRFGGADALCREFAAFVDHTLLKPEATPDDVGRACAEGLRWRFAAVVVNPCYVQLAAAKLAGSGIHVASVAGFPLGGARPEVKRLEAERALEDGASEVDLVLAIGALRAGDRGLVEQEIRAVARACHKRGAMLKVILECALLDDHEKRLGARIAVRAGADFVKTCTGFGPGGATTEDVALLRAEVGRRAGVKAAGGIRTLADAVKMLAAGASRIGTSCGPAIMEELHARASG
jgi:deoxyribose-phosphate aldolase